MKLEAKDGLRKPTEKEKKEFDRIDRSLDVVKTGNKDKFKEEAKKTHMDLQEKIFMKISDVEPNDARWFKEFCDRHTDRKQFLGIKVIRLVMERVEPLTKNILTQINSLNDRVNAVEALLQQPQPDEEEKKEEKIDIPHGQGGYHNNRSK